MELNNRLNIIGFWTLILAIIIGVTYMWVTSDDRYHRGIVESGGFRSQQKIELVWKHFEEAGFDYSAGVCLTLSEKKSIKNWTPQDMLSERQLKVLKFARLFTLGLEEKCVGPQSSVLFVQSEWYGEEPTSFELLLHDRASNRLLLLAGSI